MHQWNPPAAEAQIRASLRSWRSPRPHCRFQGQPRRELLQALLTGALSSSWEEQKRPVDGETALRSSEELLATGRAGWTASLGWATSSVVGWGTQRAGLRDGPITSRLPEAPAEAARSASLAARLVAFWAMRRVLLLVVF